MIFRITERGILEIKRGSLFKTMICPKSNRAEPCKDDCPLFGEPEEINVVQDFSYKEEIYIKLELCEGKILYCKKELFKDERR